MPLNVPVPAVQPPPVIPPPVTVTDAQMVAALEAEGYTVEPPGVTPPPTSGHPLAAWYPGGAGNPSGQKTLHSTYSPNLTQIMCDGAVQDTWADVDALMTWLGGQEGPSVMLPIPLCLQGQSLSAAWSANAGVFTTAGNKLIAAGVVAAQSILRLGWEFSGNWYPWAASADPTNFVKCFGRAATELKALGFKIFWCAAINSAPGTSTMASLYPGDEYVDIIGGDLYDECYSPSGGNNPANAANCWPAIEGGTWGLSATIAFAQSRGKPFGYGELGLASTTDNVGLGDDTTFLPNALGAAKACTSGFAVVEYFSATYAQAGRIQSAISTFPNSAAAAKSVFATL